MAHKKVTKTVKVKAVMIYFCDFEKCVAWRELFVLAVVEAEIPMIPTRPAHFETLFVLQTVAEVSVALHFILPTDLRES